MSVDIVELDVIAPAEGKRWVGRSRSASCTQSAIVRLTRVVVRLTDGRVLIVTWPQCGPEDVALRDRYFTAENMALEDAQRGIATIGHNSSVLPMPIAQEGGADQGHRG